MGKPHYISFIVPVLNMEDTLTMCLEGISNINYPKEKFEIIIVDNGSTDKSLEIARRFTSQICVDSAATIAKLRNIGAHRAKGDIIVFIDADCIIPKEWVNIALGYIENEEVGIVGSKIYNLPSDATWVEKAWKLHLDRKKGLREAYWLPSESIAMRKDLFLSLGGFDESLKTCEDVEFGYRVRKRHKLISDTQLAPLHVQKTKTLFGFFRKEIWRGHDSIHVGLKHLDQWKEIRGLAFITYYFLLIVLALPLIIALFFIKSALYLELDMTLLGIISLAIFLPIIGISIDTCRRTGQYFYFWKLVVIYSVYIFARVRAIFA